MFLTVDLQAVFSAKYSDFIKCLMCNSNPSLVIIMKISHVCHVDILHSTKTLLHWTLHIVHRNTNHTSL